MVVLKIYNDTRLRLQPPRKVPYRDECYCHSA